MNRKELIKLKSKVIGAMYRFKDKEIEAAEEERDKNVKDKMWGFAEIYDNKAMDYQSLGFRLTKFVEGIFDEELDRTTIDEDDSPYKKMWEELKKEIGNIKEEHIAEINCYVKSNMYGLAECSDAKKSEDNYILGTINEIEKERGIEQ